MKLHAPIALLSLLVAAGCSPSFNARASGGGAPAYEEDALWDDDDGTGAGDDDDDDNADPQAPELLTVDPQPDSDTHHYRDPITLRFETSAQGGAVTLRDSYGVAVEADVRWSEGWDVATVVPSVPLRPASEYEVGIRLGQSSLSYAFMTSEVGLPPEAPAQLDGRTFRLDFSGARYVEPAGVPELLVLNEGPTNWLWQMHQLDDPTPEAGRMYFDFGVGAEQEAGYAQDTCSVSGRFGGPEAEVTRAGSYFLTAPAAMTLALGTVEYTFEQAWIDGDVGASGEALHNLGFSGWVRATSLADAFGDTPGAVCDLLADNGSPCAWCPSGEGQCLYVEFDHVEADWVEALELTAVDADGIEADDECDGSDPAGGCSAAGAARPGALALLALVGLPLARRRRRL